MWYDEAYEKSVQVIKNAKKKMSLIEYRRIAKELDLLTPESLKMITNINFTEFVKNARKSSLSHFYKKDI